MFERTRYRPNVAIFVLNSEGLILIGERSDIPGAWQLPQGGIDENETPKAAMFRELEEEIGTAEVAIVHELVKPIRYDWPEELFHRGFHGQEQYYFLVRLDDESLIDLDQATTDEFITVRWVGVKEFGESVSGFKRDAYLKALELFLTFDRTLFCD